MDKKILVADLKVVYDVYRLELAEVNLEYFDEIRDTLRDTMKTVYTTNVIESSSIIILTEVSKHKVFLSEQAMFKDSFYEHSTCT